MFRLVNYYVYHLVFDSMLVLVTEFALGLEWLMPHVWALQLEWLMDVALPFSKRRRARPKPPHS
jgi:hypothetical protein